MAFSSEIEKSKESLKSIESFEDDEVVEAEGTLHTSLTDNGETEPVTDGEGTVGVDFWATLPKDPGLGDRMADKVAVPHSTVGGDESMAPVLPKASEVFPFGAKARPKRQRFDFKRFDIRRFDFKAWMKIFASDRTLWLNSGPVLVLGLLLFSIFFVTVEKPYAMILNGEPIAYVRKVGDGQRLLDQAGLELSAPYPVEANFRQDAEITYTRDGVEIKTKPTDDRIILGALKSGVTWFVDAWTIAVGNEHTVYLSSRAQALEVLEEVKRSYLPEGEVTVIDTEFVEPVELIMQQIPITDLGDTDQAFRTLTEGREPLREYKVQSGDSYWSIATQNNMSVEELKLINDASDDKLKVGQILRLNIPKPLLSVKTTVSSIRMENIPFDTVYQSNEEEWQGQSKVISAGINGTKEVAYEIDQINGFAVERRVLAETVIADPVNKIVENGVKTIVASRSDVAVAAEIRSGSTGEGGGVLVWPIMARINSPFGPRGRGNHSGLDLQADTGDPIYSAGAGKVISAGFFADYGNQVMIDHGDGLSTMYAHMSQINVTVGQEVGVQELVGLAGNTGRTTGPHLHFEVRINGSPYDPLNYLN